MACDLWLWLWLTTKNTKERKDWNYHFFSSGFISKVSDDTLNAPSVFNIYMWIVSWQASSLCRWMVWSRWLMVEGCRRCLPHDLPLVECFPRCCRIGMSPLPYMAMFGFLHMFVLLEAWQCAWQMRSLTRGEHVCSWKWRQRYPSRTTWGKHRNMWWVYALTTLWCILVSDMILVYMMPYVICIYL